MTHFLRNAITGFLVCAGLAGVPAMAQQDGTPPAAVLDRLQRADGAMVVPDRFLRRWDPVTVFFQRDTGPAAGGAEDAPERFVAMSPVVPGAWQWLNARALQFRPADPWTPLARVSLTVGARTTQLVPLLPAPVSTIPAADSEPVPDLDTIGLVFPDPVDPQALARLLSIELRASSGAQGVPAEVLTAQDITIRTIERRDRSEQQVYQVVLRRPVPDGRALVLRLRLSDVQGMDDPAYELRLRGVTPFGVTDVICGRGFSPDTQDGVMQCAPQDSSGNGLRRELVVSFSEKPEAIDIVRARDLLRISPPVDNLAVQADGQRLRITGRFEADVPYELNITTNGLKDVRGRTLDRGYTQRFSFLPNAPQLVWGVGQGIVERNGPQMVPMRGRGYDRVDLRIHQIDPLSSDFWPFPNGGLTTDDDVAPPLPGNEPRAWNSANDVGRTALALRIRAMGSPAVSELVTLPTQRGGTDARFGLNVTALLAKIAGASQPGTYLLGMRPVDGGGRRWMRVQVTDLALATVEEADRVRFTVTSLGSARSVEGASIRLEGIRDDKLVPLVSGTTGADGSFTWSAPASARESTPRTLRSEVRRIVVVKGADTLVLDTNAGPQQYAQENWTQPEAPWLSWTQGNISARDEAPKTLCHIFTERPIYRPEDPVHIQGFVRTYRQGALSFAQGSGTLVVQGPNDQEWTVPVTLDAMGGFYHLFSETTEATGDYRVFYRSGANNQSCEMVASFKKESYRLPTFEVVMSGPERTALDKAFDVNLLARYFAGGATANRPIRWRVTQFPYTWTPPSREGFLFSTDARFSSIRDFRSTPVLERDATTDSSGAAHISLDPTIEPTAQPRRYVVEATVTGDDDLQVRSTQQVLALPPFVLGVKVARYLPQAGAIDPEILAINAEGKPLAGLTMTARLIRRNWNSVLQASDFSQGAAHYVTEVVEETVEERQITSADDVQKLHFEARDAGVYVVELEAEDQIGRKQTVRVDLFMAGDTPVTWPRAPSQTVTVTTEQKEYTPGDTATLLIQSPFQTARALAIVEEPDGRFRYDWVDIANGVGRYTVQIRREHLPRLPVHFLLMRGRLALPAQAATAPFDQGKPVTLAATSWVSVRPVKHQVTVAINAPAVAQPGEEIEVTLKLTDDTGRPLSGEVAFWMVDQAVLTLAREAPLDPLRNFIVARQSRMAARDTRNMAFGVIPLEETPGGDGGEDEFGLDNISVRRNFTPVPVYMPRVQVGADGTARVRVRLPDTLTVYRFRAKAVSGPDRFGVGVGEIRIRQPIVAQPTLPRFVRPGDVFNASMIARVIEGPLGGMRASIAASGLDVTGAREQDVTVGEDRSARVMFDVRVPESESATSTVRLRMGVQRMADRAGDAVQIDLPVRPDRMPIRLRQVLPLDAGGGTQSVAMPADIRTGTYSGRVSVTGDAALLQMIGGLNYILETPFGGVEQYIALGTAELALRPFTPLLRTAGIEDRMARDIPAAVNAIRQAVDEDGLVAFWPRTRGSVWLTASAYRFLVAAERAELQIDRGLKDRLAQVLTRALRSDYRRLLSGEEIRERVAALIALAEGGDVQRAYAAELARRAAFMPTETLAQTVQVLTMLPEQGQPMTNSVLEALWLRVQMMDRNSRSVYNGLTETSGDPMILPSEVRALSSVVRAVARVTPDDIRLPPLREALLRLGQTTAGWGNTNTNAAALLALAASWTAPAISAPVTLTLGTADQEGVVASATPLLSWPVATPTPIRIHNRGASALVTLVEQSYVPTGLGATAQPVLNGLALNRVMYRAHAGAPLERLQPGADGVVQLKAGDVVEDVTELVNPEDRTHVAITLPIAAGMEPLNAALATATADATATTELTLAPDWVSYRDDSVMYVYTHLPKGNYRLAFRTRALVPGSFTQPPGEAATMYRPDVYGTSAGQRISISR